MYMEVGVRHHRPHFHAYYQDSEVVVAVDEIEVLAGEFPKKQLRLILAWAELNQIALIDNWAMLQAGEGFFPIEPLN